MFRNAQIRRFCLGRCAPFFSDSFFTSPKMKKLCHFLELKIKVLQDVTYLVRGGLSYDYYLISFKIFVNMVE